MESYAGAMTAEPSSPARWIDLVLVVAAAPFVVLMDAPVLGYAVGAVAWIAARVFGHLIERRAERAADLRSRTGLALMGSFARAWLVGLAILAVGVLAGRQDGLAAAALAIAAFTVYLVTSLVLRPLERPSHS